MSLKENLASANLYLSRSFMGLCFWLIYLFDFDLESTIWVKIEAENYVCGWCVCVF